MVAIEGVALVALVALVAPVDPILAALEVAAIVVADSTLAAKMTERGAVALVDPILVAPVEDCAVPMLAAEKPVAVVEEIVAVDPSSVAVSEQAGPNLVVADSIHFAAAVLVAPTVQL